MTMRTIILLAACLFLSSCYKDELDPGGLTSNPFDADYTGTEIFTVEDSYVEVYSPPTGGTALRFRVVVKVNTELFPRQTPYWVRFRQGSSDGFTELVSTSMPTDRIQLSAAPVQSGHAYCWEIQLGNAGTWGGGNDVCATAQ